MKTHQRDGAGFTLHALNYNRKLDTKKKHNNVA